MLKRALAGITQVSATRCQLRRAEASKPSLQMRQGPSGQPVADIGWIQINNHSDYLVGWLVGWRKINNFPDSKGGVGWLECI